MEEATSQPGVVVNPLVRRYLGKSVQWPRTNRFSLIHIIEFLSAWSGSVSVIKSRVTSGVLDLQLDLFQNSLPGSV
jgi:hypothetical protein